MIWESEDWKKPLLQMAKRLAFLKKAEDLTEKQLAQIERDIFIGFDSVRKLLESITKLTDATKALQIQVSWYPNLSPVTWRNNHRLEILYDFGKPHQETRDLRFICGRIIHSFIFAPYVGDEGGLDGIMFTSDIDRNKRLYAMEIDDVITVFKCVGNDYPSDVHWHMDAQTGEDILQIK